MDHADYSLKERNVKSNQSQWDLHKKIHRGALSTSRIPVKQCTEPRRPVLREIYNIQSNHHKTRKDSCHQISSTVPISGLTHLSTFLPPSLPRHNTCQHRELQHQGSQHNQCDFNFKTKLQSPECPISSHPISVTSDLSNKDSLSKDRLPSVPDSSSLETAHLWDLVRLTVPHLPQKSTSTMTSYQHSSLSQFSHQIPNIKPNGLSVSTDGDKITSRLSQLQSDNDPCGKLDLEKQLDSNDAIHIAQKVNKYKASDLVLVMTECFFGIPSFDSCRGLNSTTSKPPDSILSSNKSTTYTCPRCSPLHLDQLELRRAGGVDLKSIPSDTFGLPAQIDGKPTDKSIRSKSSGAAPSNATRGRALSIAANKTSISDAASDSTTRGRAPSRAASKGSILNHTSGSFIIRTPLKLADTSSLTFGPDNSFLDETFPPGIVDSRFSTSFLVDDNMCLEFFRVIFTVRKEVQAVRRLLVKHAQATVLDYLSVERADKGEDKMQTLQNVCYMGCIVHDTHIEFWEVKYTPNQQQCGIPNSGGQNHPSSRSSAPFLQCELHALGSLDVSKVANVELCRKFLHHIMRWGLTKYCMGYIDNLHRVTWSKDCRSKAKKMNTEETSTYWSS